jgi:hypothetical protein
MATNKSTRTNINDYAWLHLTVNPELKAALKARALLEGRTQTALVIDALRNYFILIEV